LAFYDIKNVWWDGYKDNLAKRKRYPPPPIGVGDYYRIIKQKD
jgi:hypothetical protein